MVAIPDRPATTEHLQLRSPTGDEFVPYAHAVDQAFGEYMTEAQLEIERMTFERDRFVGAFTPDGEIVGTAGAFTFGIALPGGDEAGCAGVTAVGVRQDHRRRGLLSRMMAWLLDDAEGRGEPFAALWASEGAIYGRYGFGPAIPTFEVEVPRRQLVLRRPVATDTVRQLTLEAALRELPGLYARARSRRPGMLSRNEAWWHRIVTHDPEESREGAGPRLVAVIPDGGYVVYRLQPRWQDGAPAGVVRVEELVSLHPDATGALWGYLATTDLTTTIRARGRPADDALRAMVVDPAQVRVRAGSPVYLRILDVAAAVARRRYPVDDRLVIGVEDPMWPAHSGTFAVEVRDGRGRAERVTTEPDLRMGSEELSTLYLGGVRPTVLSQAGRLEIRTPGAAERLERLFASELAPVHGNEF